MVEGWLVEDHKSKSSGKWVRKKRTGGFGMVEMEGRGKDSRIQWTLDTVFEVSTT